MIRKNVYILLPGIFFILLYLEPTSSSNITSIESNVESASCQIGNSIECKNNKLNLMSVGCPVDNFTSEREGFNLDNLANSSACLQLYCKVCREYENWSEWSQCCQNKSCDIEVVGIIGKFRKARYRNLSAECQSKFSIDLRCTFEVEEKKCIEGRANPNPGGGAGGNQAPPTEKGITSVTKIIIFAVAGVVVFALFGFAGVRLVRTMYLQPPQSSRSRIHSNRSNHVNGQYSNASFRSSPDATFTNEVDPRMLLVHPQRGHRMAPVNRLSIIQEEEDAASALEMDGVNQDRLSVNSPLKGGKLDGSNALEYMDDIIHQIEDDERAIQMEDPNYRCSVVSRESFKLLNKLGWNPEARNAGKQIERLKEFANTEKLDSSDLSLASALLLKSKSSSTSSNSTSSLSDNESCYSLKDIEVSNSSPACPRQYSSEPDLSRMKHTIPDIEEMLTDDSNSDVFIDDPLV